MENVFKKNDDFDLDWFDLAKYEPVKEFELSDWYMQLIRRIGLKTHNNREMPRFMAYVNGLSLDDTNAEKYLNTPFRVEEKLRQDWEDIMVNPILAPINLRTEKPLRQSMLFDLPYLQENPDFQPIKKFVDTASLTGDLEYEIYNMKNAKSIKNNAFSPSEEKLMTSFLANGPKACISNTCNFIQIPQPQLSLQLLFPLKRYFVPQLNHDLSLVRRNL